MAWYGDRYRELAVDLVWLARSLIDNAVKEGAGARKLWRLSGRTRDPAIAEQIRRHALDESRHALVYIAILATALPGAVPDTIRRSLMGLSPRYRFGEHPRRRRPASRRRVLDELIQMNIGEIRTRIHQLLLAPVIKTCCPRSGRRRLSRMLESLMHDETRHIEYTARLIERAAGEGEQAYVENTMARRLAEFNRITVAEVGGGGDASTQGVGFDPGLSPHRHAVSQSRTQGSRRRREATEGPGEPPVVQSQPRATPPRGARLREA
jgi:hypothetical protein